MSTRICIECGKRYGLDAYPRGGGSARHICQWCRLAEWQSKYPPQQQPPAAPAEPVGEQGALFGEPPKRPAPATPHTALRADARDTSRAAAARVRPKTGSTRQRILTHIQATIDGVTDEEGQETLGIPGNSYRPQRVKLVDDGWVYDSGLRRKTRSGSPAAVWMYLD